MNVTGAAGGAGSTQANYTLSDDDDDATAGRRRRRRDVVIKSDSVRDANGNTVEVVTLVSRGGGRYANMLQLPCIMRVTRRSRVPVPIVSVFTGSCTGILLSTLLIQALMYHMMLITIVTSCLVCVTCVP